MERVVLNLVRNAIKCTPQGGAIEVITRSDIVGGRAGALIEVRDSGVGIPEEHLSRVTERYFRVGEHVSGSGLGLAISKEIVQLHGGALHLESPPRGHERGTLVRVSLPRVDAPRVWLLCEAGAQRELVEAVSLMGYTIEQSDPAAVDVSADRDHDADIVIIQLRAREMRDMELLAMLKTDPRTAACRFIAVGSSAIADPVKSEIMEGYGVACLEEPWSPDDLFDCMA
ncbi:MAG: ATP-binding protein [Verrucomicrobia bacterium]|nr:ATP-binding protein [Verrucomicrobiota bacterium]MDA1086914.1 ATP-binding protein [Verrucomicrobiota bacterium]